MCDNAIFTANMSNTPVLIIEMFYNRMKKYSEEEFSHSRPAHFFQITAFFRSIVMEKYYSLVFQ